MQASWAARATFSIARDTPPRSSSTLVVPRASDGVTSAASSRM